ncbi:MAG: DUF72 domain-containing protein [Promethearchaeota archaeon]
MNSEHFYIGTSGFSYPEWKGIVYPKKLPQSKMFTYYSEFFNTSEINSTFYQIPRKNTAKIWAKKSPPKFKFSIKIPKLVTHDAKLDLDSLMEPLSKFIRNMMPLIRENKILAFLLQLPPKFGKGGETDFKKLEIFSEHWNSSVRDRLDSNGLNAPELAVEFRNEFWIKDENIDSTFGLLRRHHLVNCAVVEPLLPTKLEITSESLFYIRFHGFGVKPWFNYCFTDEQLDGWAEKLNPILIDIREQKDSNRKAVLYFNNHFSGYAVKNALYIAKKMELQHKKGVKDLTKSLKILNRSQKSIDDFF